jgi:hypothetical protein
VSVLINHCSDATTTVADHEYFFPMEDYPKTDKKPSHKVASEASKVLRDPRNSKTDKSLAASILSNREPKKKGK